MAAVVFDFDGLILDTETPVVEAWGHVYRQLGLAPPTRDDWARSLGVAAGHPDKLDPFAELCERLGRSLDAALVHEVRRRVRDELIQVEPLRPGVEALLDDAERLGVPTAVASSSGAAWVEGHLRARGLRRRFAVVSCAGGDVPGKPDPATYQRACAALGVSPGDAVALEDSPNGVRAAKAAGLFCVAVPAGVSAGLDFGPADRVVASLEEVTIDALRRR